MAYMQCPECKLTVPATATYCAAINAPCLTTMEPRDRFRRRSVMRSSAMRPRRTAG